MYEEIKGIDINNYDDIQLNPPNNYLPMEYIFGGYKMMPVKNKQLTSRKPIQILHNQSDDTFYFKFPVWVDQDCLLGKNVHVEKLIFYRDDIPGGYVYTSSGINEKLGEIALNILGMDTKLFPWFIKAWEFRTMNRVHEMSHGVRLVELFSIFENLSACTVNIIKFVKFAIIPGVTISDWNEILYLKFCYHTLFIHLNGRNYHDFINGINEMEPIAERGGLDLLKKKEESLPENNILWDQNTISKYGCQIFWLLHIASPILEKFYQKCIASTKYPIMSIIEIQPDAFAWEFVYSWTRSCSFNINKIINLEEENFSLVLNRVLTTPFDELKNIADEESCLFKLADLIKMKISYTYEKDYVFHKISEFMGNSKFKKDKDKMSE